MIKSLFSLFSPSFMSSSKLICCGFYLCSLLLSWGEDESLISNPPFKQIKLRQSSSVVQNISTQGTLNQRFELSGVMGVGGVLKFSLHDKNTNKPIWIALGETYEGIKLESYDREKKGLVMIQAGRKEMLLIREMKTGVKSLMIPNYRNMSQPTMPSNSYPKPPPPLPKPNKLIEQLRKTKKIESNV